MKNMRKILFMLCLVVFVYASLQLVAIFQIYRQNTASNQGAVTTFVTPIAPEPTQTPTTSTEVAREPDFVVDFSALQALNKDIVGWLWIQDTNINFPLLHGSDNSKYLTTTYNGGQNQLGSIFLDYRCQGDFSGKNTIIYGHNGKNGGMFHSLKNFTKQTYANQHPYFFIMTPQGYQQYALVSAYVTDANSDSYTIDWSSDDDFAAYEQKIIDRSAIATTVTVTPEDKLVTLSTCTNNAHNERLLVHGVLIGTSQQ